jgi:hypothetical protein
LSRYSSVPADAELELLNAATCAVPQTAPGLLAWIDSTCEWELNRRRDFDYPLLPPEAAIDPSEDAVSISAAMVLRNQFGRDSPAVLAFFDALVELLTGGGRKQQRRAAKIDVGATILGSVRSGQLDLSQRIDNGALVQQAHASGVNLREQASRRATKRTDRIIALAPDRAEHLPARRNWPRMIVPPGSAWVNYVVLHRPLRRGARVGKFMPDRIGSRKGDFLDQVPPDTRHRDDRSVELGKL